MARAIAPPRVKQKHIPYGAKRKREMAAYARRHYGIDSYRLRNPRVIVEHLHRRQQLRERLQHVRS